jgi:hypothetical protein
MGFFNDIDWNKVAEKGLTIAEKAGEAMEKKQKEIMRKYQKMLRQKSDQQIENTLRNVDPSDGRYFYIKKEAMRRGLL